MATKISKPGNSSSTDDGSNMTTTVIVNRQLNVKPFVISSDMNETAVRWAKWKKDIERQFRFFGLADPSTKRDGLIIYGGQSIADLEDSLPDLTPEEDEDIYSQLVRKLDKHFLPRKNKDYARFQFGNLSQHENENMAQYYTRLRETAKKCEFNNEDEAVRDHLIKTMTNNRLRAKTIRNNWVLTQILEEAAMDEESTNQANEIEKKLKSETEYKRVNQIIKGRRRYELELCGRCGSKHERRQCKAYGLECHKCGKRNHFARMCKSIQGEKEPGKHKYRERNERQEIRKENYNAQGTREIRSGSKNKFNRRRIRHVELNKDEKTSESEDDSMSGSADEDIERIVKHLNIRRTMKEKDEKYECSILINGAKVIVEPDTGADVNVMDEYQFELLRKRVPVETELQETKIKLKTLTEKLPVVGECKVMMENETRQVEATIAIIEGKIDSHPLLGRKTLEELGMVKFDASGRLKEPNRDIKSLNRINHENRDLAKIIKQYEARFKGIGQVKRDGKIVEINLPTKENVEPVAQKPRRVPYHLVEPLKKRIDEFVGVGIMEKVPESESISWCSPLVVQPKPGIPMTSE